MARLLKVKQNLPYSLVMGWLRCCLGLVCFISEELEKFAFFQDCGNLASDLAVAEGRLIFSPDSISS